MKVYDAAGIRNIACVGHSGAGKTQLVSAMLFDAGTVNRLGKVDEGTTVTDFDDEEIARKHTLCSSPAFAEWNKTKINLIDTPGVANFISDTRAAMRVVDATLFVVDAVAGVEVQTEAIWKIAQEQNLPRMIALNRYDRERANLDRALESLRAAFGRTVVPLTLPIGEEKNFSGVIDLVSQRALTFAADGTGTMTAGEIPAALRDKAAAERDALIEMIAEADDALMERFFEEGTLSPEEMMMGLKRGVMSGRLFPLFCTSALMNIGIQPLLDAIIAYAPSPLERPFVARKRRTGFASSAGAGAGANGTAMAAASMEDTGEYEPIPVAAAESAPYTAFVWKTVADPFAGRITLFRVVSGSLRADSTVHNLSRDIPERLGHLLIQQGKTTIQVPEIKAGDIGAVAKLKETQSGETIGDKNTAFEFPALVFPEPLLSYAIEPKSRGDEDKISTSLHRLQEEDPTIHYSRDPQTKEALLSGQGQTHIEVTVAKLKRRFGVDVNLKLPRIPYRETITMPTEAHGRHKKQTGGHGQFGDCKIRMEPLPRGSEFEFVDDIFGGSIPRQFIPAVEKGIQESRLRGYLAGYPVVDFRVTVFDGSYHAVDSNELSFKMAGSIAFRDAMSKARPTLLEPVMNVEVYGPSEYAGDLMGDLNSRRGRISGMDTRGNLTIIKAQVPMSEMLTYEQHLTSATGGRGSYSMDYSHYEEVPSHLQGKIIEKHKAERAGVHEEE
jgi:elongation factor G